MAYSITTNLTNLLSSDLLEAFMDGFISDATDLSWIRVTPTDRNEVVNMGVNPPSAYFTHPEGQDIPTSAIEEGFKATYSHINLAIGFAVSLQTKLTMPRESLVGFVAQLGAAARRRMSQDAYDILNNGTTTAGPDGKALFVTDHPSNTGDQSNAFASDLDAAGYEQAQREMMLQKTPDGLLSGMQATTLIVPPAKRTDAYTLNAAEFTSAALQPNINITQGIRTIVARDLDDSSRWFLLDDSASRLNMYVLRGPGPRIIEEDEDSLRMEVRDRMIYSTGFDTWRGTVSSSV